MPTNGGKVKEILPCRCSNFQCKPGYHLTSWLNFLCHCWSWVICNKNKDIKESHVTWAVASATMHVAVLLSPRIGGRLVDLQQRLYLWYVTCLSGKALLNLLALLNFTCKINGENLSVEPGARMCYVLGLEKTFCTNRHCIRSSKYVNVYFLVHRIIIPCRSWKLHMF